MENKTKNLVLLVDLVVNALFRTNWSYFGPKIQPRMNNGFPKYQGFLFVGTELVTDFRLANMSGFLLNHEKSAEILMRKFAILEENPEFVTSAEGRRPETDDWGGAVRASQGVNLLFGGTGLPEVVDNYVVSTCMFKYDLLSGEDYSFATYVDSPHVYQMCDFVEMSRNSYMAMANYINNNISDLTQWVKAA